MVIHSSKTGTNNSFTDTTRGVKTRVADNAPGREKIAFFGGGSLVALCSEVRARHGVMLFCSLTSSKAIPCSVLLALLEHIVILLR